MGRSWSSSLWSWREALGSCTTCSSFHWGFCGVAGALLSPARRLWGLCAGALIAGTVLIYAVTFPEKRYRFPIEPLLAIAAVGAAHRYFVPGSCRPECVGAPRAGE